MYPLAIVQDTVRIYQSAFSRFARDFNARALKLLERSSRRDILNGLVWLEESVSHDADIFTWLQELRDQHGDDIPKEKFQKQLALNAQHVNAYSRAQFKNAIESGRTSLRGTGAKHPTVGLPASMPRPTPAPRVPMVDFTRGDNVAAEKVNGFVKENVGLISDLSRQHASAVVDAIRDGVIHGKSLKEIAQQITEQTQKDINQAAFWAEDQSGNLFADLTKERQLSAGAPGYIWRTMKDSRVRDKHEHLEGTYHRWDRPPMSGSSQRRLHCHPGEDYRCRCWGEMAWGPQDAERELNPDKLAIQFQQNRISK